MGPQDLDCTGEDGYYSPRSDSNFSSFTEPNLPHGEEESMHPRLTAADPKIGTIHERNVRLTESNHSLGLGEG